MNTVNKIGVDVTDGDLDLMEKSNVRPPFKLDLLRNEELVTLQQGHFRASVESAVDGGGRGIIDPFDAMRMSPELKEDLLKRDSANALRALSLVLKKFDLAKLNEAFEGK